MNLLSRMKAVAFLGIASIALGSAATAVNVFAEGGSGGPSFPTPRFQGANWTCYDGTTGNAGDTTTCKGLGDWNSAAQAACKDHCNTESGKCGVNNMSLGPVCGRPIPPQGSDSSVHSDSAVSTPSMSDHSASKPPLPPRNPGSGNSDQQGMEHPMMSMPPMAQGNLCDQYRNYLQQVQTMLTSQPSSEQLQSRLKELTAKVASCDGSQSSENSSMSQPKQVDMTPVSCTKIGPVIKCDDGTVVDLMKIRMMMNQKGDQPTMNSVPNPEPTSLQTVTSDSSGSAGSIVVCSKHVEGTCTVTVCGKHIAKACRRGKDASKGPSAFVRSSASARMSSVSSERSSESVSSMSAASAQ